jgi:N-acetylglucosaminyltransferase
MYHGWLWQQPLVTQIRAMQILLTPVTQLLALAYIAFVTIQLNWLLLVGRLSWLLVSRLIRSFSHLREQPRDIVLLPLVTFCVIIIALPIKIWAFISMNKHGWLTRTTVSIGGEGQTEASLYGMKAALEINDFKTPLPTIEGTR